MIVYVVIGGMLATKWVQIIKAILLMVGNDLLSLLVLAHFWLEPLQFFRCGDPRRLSRQRRARDEKLSRPGLRFTPANHGALDLISLGMALVFGTAGLPHILVRFSRFRMRKPRASASVGMR